MIVFLSQEKWKEMLSSLKGTRQLLKEGIAETSDVTKVYVDDLCGLFATKKYD